MAYLMICKKRKKFVVAGSYEYKETDRIHSVQTSLKSHHLWVTLYKPVLKPVQACTSLSKPVQACTSLYNLYKLVQACTSLYKHVHACTSMFMPEQPCPSLYNPLYKPVHACIDIISSYPLFKEFLI